MLTNIVCGLAALASLAAASPLEIRGTSSPKFCSAINSAVTKLKAQSSATPFCSSFLRIPKATVTSTSLATSVVSVTVTSQTITTVTAPAVLTTAISTTSSTSTHLTTALVTVPSFVEITLSASSTQTTQTITITTDCTPYASQTLGARAAGVSTSTVAVATPSALKSWVASAISSACSCLSIPTQTVSAKVTSVTAISVTATAIATSTLLVTPTSTVTSVVTDTISVDGVTTTRQFIPITTTVTPSPVTMTTTETKVVPSCVATCTHLPGDYYPFDFDMFFAGTGVALNANNPANQFAYFTTFPGTLRDCEAVNQCKAFTNNDYNAGSSFNVRYQISTSQWVCEGYYGTLTDTSYFNVFNSDIGRSYGYSEPTS